MCETLCVCVFSDTVNTTIDGVAVIQTKFEPTKKMSTYLLAIVISDYTHISAQGDTLVTDHHLTRNTFYYTNKVIPKLIKGLSDAGMRVR